MKADAGAIRQFRKIAVLVGGCTLIGVGALLLVLPGPGLLTIFGGVALLATEFLWARRWLQRVKDELARRGITPRASRGDDAPATPSVASKPEAATPAAPPCESLDKLAKPPGTG